MIKRPDQIKLLALGLPDVPANRSSSSESKNETSTTTNVTDRRFVNDGGGAGVSGDNNSVFNSVSTSNYVTDLGAIAGAMDLAKTGIQATHDSLTSAANLANQTFNKTVDSNQTMFGINASNMMDGFSKLIDASKTVMQTAQDVNRTATQDVQQAYANAQEISNGQKFLVAGGLVIAGIVAVTAIKGKVL
ncbi:hypothetical protein WT81_29440 [Burkholderia stagnalis]|uniref:hypothetical protein n=1 Tax=Burkholderia stagnalis TaxID=1503054 RepID=UPI00075F8A9C|nr:hypothetical protein [Burkholderia stagnalis]KWK49884.1 hypothetical protein WT81_29440 [Burkholderia stagnalis]KWK57666.1 hypothetical protein WT80_28845 [Burkholderia stagnalis]